MLLPSSTIATVDLYGRPPRTQPSAFLSRCETLLADACTLAGTSEDAIVDAFRTATLRLERTAAADTTTRRSWLGASPNGSPVELCESIATTPCGPRFFCDPSPAAALERAHALMRGTALAKGDGIDNLLQNAPSVWLGAEAIPGTASIARTIYVDKILAPRGLPSTKTARALLRHVGITPTSEARRSLAILAHNARLRMFECEVRPDNRTAASMSFCRPLDREIVTLAAACGVPGEPFAKYLDGLLRLPREGADRRATTTLSISPRGEVTSVSIYHYAAPHFTSDAHLRSAILDNAHAFHWQSAPYRTASRSNGDTADGSRARCYVRFGVQRGGAARLDVFTSPGRLLTDNACANRGDSYVDLV